MSLPKMTPRQMAAAIVESTERLQTLVICQDAAGAANVALADEHTAARAWLASARKPEQMRNYSDVRAAIKAAREVQLLAQPDALHVTIPVLT